MLPGSLIGIGIGWLTAAIVTADMVRLIVGAVAIVFVGRWLFQLARHGAQPCHQAEPCAGCLLGRWSPASPASSPMSAARRSRSTRCRSGWIRKIFTGTSVIFFAITNAVKLVPYFALGQFDATNLTASAVLMPVAPLATLAGAWLVRRMRPEVFYTFTYCTVAIIAVKLIYDGVFDVLH